MKFCTFTSPIPYTYNRDLLRIILRLCVPKLVILAGGIGHQLVMGALLDDLPFMEYGDLVAEFTGGESVGDINGGLIRHDVVEAAIDLRFGNGGPGRQWVRPR